MELGGRVLGPARSNFNDYVGTVAADDAEAVVDRPSLYQLAQIDRDRYTIPAIDLKADRPVPATGAAIDRAAHGISLHAAIAALGESLGAIPVVEFNVPAATIEDFITHAFSPTLA